MSFEAAGQWAEHLTKPYALAGFAVLVVASLAWVLTKLPSARLKSAETHSLLRLVIIGSFMLGVLAIALSFALPLTQPPAQQISNIKGSTIAVGGKQAAIINQKQTADMHSGKQDCEQASQTINGVENSQVAVGGCEASATAHE